MSGRGLENQRTQRTIRTQWTNRQLRVSGVCLSRTGFHYRLFSQYSQYSQSSHSQNGVSGVPLSRRGFQNQWTIWTGFHYKLFSQSSQASQYSQNSHSQNKDSRVLLSRSAWPLRRTGRTSPTVQTDSHLRVSGVRLSGSGFAFMFSSHTSHSSHYSHSVCFKLEIPESA